MNEIDIEPYFQPIFSMSSKDICGFEVLARGRSGTGGLVQPDLLFRDKNADDRIRIDRIVREKAFEKLSRLSGTKRLFINVMPEYFLRIQNIRQDSHLLRMCRRYGVPPENIVIEITEHAADRFPEIVRTVKAYQEAGFVIAIDDWGAEHSNFERLSMIRPSIVKLDGQFLWEAASDPNIAEIFCTAAAMISKLGVKVIAEGVEKAEYLYMALDAGCPMAQGFLLGTPAPDIPDKSRLNGLLDRVFFQYRDGKIKHLIREKKRINQYARAMTGELKKILSLKPSTGELLVHLRDIMEKHREVVKAYVLSPEGVQVSANLIKTDGHIRPDAGFVQKDWSWRPYYLETLVNRQLFQSRYTVSGPYVDPETGRSIITVCIDLDRHIVCVDFIMED